MTPDPRIGTELAGYRIDALIGSGGMGTVYLAEHSRLRRRVALKILAPDLARDASFRARFERESRLAASLEHPNIVPVYDAGEVDGTAYIAMRYVDGPDLGTVLEENGRVEPARTVAIMTQIASALDAAHAHGLIHRDVKPGNILLEDEHAYLADFGITKSLGTSTAFTETGRFVGTLDYAAPEQIEGGELDARTDQYALACVAFQCLTGSPPFAGDLLATVMHGHLAQTPPKASELVSGLPSTVDPVLVRGLAKARADRFETCGAFARSLAGSVSEAVTPGGPRTRRRVVLAAAGALVAALALVVGLMWGDTGTPSRSPSPLASGSGSPSEAALPASLVGVRSIDAETLKPGEVVVTPSYASSLAVGGEFVWVRVQGPLQASERSTELRKVSASTNRLVGEVGDVGACIIIPGLNTDCVAVGDGYVWSPGWSCLVGSCPTTLYRIDPSTNGVDLHRNLASADEASGLFAGDVRDVEFAAGSVWVAADNGRDGPVVYRYTPKTDELVTIPLPTPGGAGPIAYGEGFLWVIDQLYGGLRRIDPATNEVVGELTLLDGAPYDIAVGNGFVWVTDRQGDRVLKIDPSLTRGPTSIPVGDDPRAIAFGEGAVWVANQAADSVTRIDMLTGATTEISVGGVPGDVAVGDGRVWLTLGGYRPQQ